MLVPAALLFALALMIVFQQWSQNDGTEELPIRSTIAPDSTMEDRAREDIASWRLPGSDPAPAGDDAAGGRSNLLDSPLQGSIELGSFEQNTAPEPYEPTAAILTAVRDDEIATPGFPEQEGLIELFHRWRSGPPVEVEQFAVPWAELSARASELRGRRTRKTFRLIEEPLPRFIPRNRSGVRRYWEAFARDLDGGHLVRLDFVERPDVLRPKDEIEMDVDFLRLYRYTPLGGGGDVAVPEYVALRAEHVVAAPRDDGGWQPFLIAGGLSFLALALLVLQGVTGGSARTQRRKARPGARSRAGDPPPASPDPGAS